MLLTGIILLFLWLLLPVDWHLVIFGTTVFHAVTITARIRILIINTSWNILGNYMKIYKSMHQHSLGVSTDTPSFLCDAQNSLHWKKKRLPSRHSSVCVRARMCARGWMLLDEWTWELKVAFSFQCFPVDKHYVMGCGWAFAERRFQQFQWNLSKVILHMSCSPW